MQDEHDNDVRARHDDAHSTQDEKYGGATYEGEDVRLAGGEAAAAGDAPGEPRALSTAGLAAIVESVASAGVITSVASERSTCPESNPTCSSSAIAGGSSRARTSIAGAAGAGTATNGPGSGDVLTRASTGAASCDGGSALGGESAMPCCVSRISRRAPSPRPDGTVRSASSTCKVDVRPWVRRNACTSSKVIVASVSALGAGCAGMTFSAAFALALARLL